MLDCPVAGVFLRRKDLFKMNGTRSELGDQRTPCSKDKKPRYSTAYPSGAATVPTDGERSDMAMGGSNSNQAKNLHLGSRVCNTRTKLY